MIKSMTRERWAKQSGLAGLVFDLDGTLIDSAPQIIHAANEALGSISSLCASDIGPPLEAMLQRAMGKSYSEAALVEAVAAFKLAYDGICCQSEAFPSVEASLRGLSEMGVPVAMATNKRSHVARRIIQAKGWEGLFPLGVHGQQDFVDAQGSQGGKARGLALICSSSGIAPAQLGMVGDLDSDFQAALQAGFGAYLHCPWGGLADWAPKVFPEGMLVAMLASAEGFSNPMDWVGIPR